MGNINSIDPELRMAINVQSQKGVYALLLGSGISISAGIKTGKGITRALVEKLMIREKGEIQDPDKWYLESYNESPDYSKLIDRLAPMPDERQKLLNEFFVASPSDIEQGITKAPTKAHKAIARLIKEGYFRIVITTNFDRLLERALDEVGVDYKSIYDSGIIDGLKPLIHQDYCLIVKVHGDYQDTRIRNTQAELSKYDTKMNRLLRKILFEHGLIICGWSGDSDYALRKALLRNAQSRYSVYWLCKDAPLKDVEEVREFIQGEKIKIESADSVFENLKDNVLALEDIRISNPVTTGMAIGIVKRYLSEEKYRIRLSDYVLEMTDVVVKQLEQIVPRDATAYKDKVLVVMNRLLSIMMTGVYWGSETNDEIWIESINRIINRNKARMISDDNQDYPEMVMMASLGVVSLKRRDHRVLKKVLFEPRWRDKYGVPCDILFGRCKWHRELVGEDQWVDNMCIPDVDNIFNRNADLVYWKRFWILVMADEIIRKNYPIDEPFVTYYGRKTRYDEGTKSMLNEIQYRREKSLSTWIKDTEVLEGGQIDAAIEMMIQSITKQSTR